MQQHENNQPEKHTKLRRIHVHRHVQLTSRYLAAICLLIMLTIAMPFALQGGRTVGYASNQKITKQAPTPDIPATVQPVVVASEVKTTSGDVQAALDNWMANHSGTVAVTVRGITDPSINASVNGGSKMYTASLYKLYAIELVYGQINAGNWSENQGGIDISTCVQRMIVVSDNTCAVAFGYLLGWQAQDSLLHAQGYGGTSLDINYPWSTSNDVAQLLVNLETGKLVNTAQREAMLGFMRQQIYRSGIPAGNPGVAVADKVGIFDTYTNDAGVVYGPKGTYVVSIMTNGANFTAIQDLSATIASVMNK